MSSSEVEVDVYQGVVYLEDRVHQTTANLTPDQAFAIAAALTRAADKAVTWQLRHPDAK